MKKINIYPVSPKTYALIAAIIGSILIGTSPIFVRLSTIDPMAIGFFRFFFAFPFLALWMILVSSREKTTEKFNSLNPYTFKHVLMLTGAGIFFACDIALWHYSLQKTTVINSTLLNSMAPIFITVIAWLFLREKISWLNGFGIALAVFGTLLLVIPDSKSLELKFYGDILALSSALFYTSYVLMIKKLRKYFNSATVMTWSSTSCMYVLGLLSFACEINIIPQLKEQWIPLVGLALIVQVLGQGLITFALKQLTATFSSVTMMIAPVVSTLMAGIFFQESLTIFKVLGGFVILTGIIVVHRNEEK